MLPDSARTAAEAAAALGCDVGQIVKSLVFTRDGEPVVVLCAGTGGSGRSGWGSIGPAPMRSERQPASPSAAFRRSAMTARWRR